jgi:hypothetical protein
MWSIVQTLYVHSTSTEFGGHARPKSLEFGVNACPRVLGPAAVPDLSDLSLGAMPDSTTF